MRYNINGKEFSNKTDIMNFCRELIEKNKDKVLEGQDLLFFKELIKSHPKSKKKLQFDYIKVEIDKLNRNYCLWSYKKVGNIEVCDDISWHKCVNHIPVVGYGKNIDYVFRFGKYKGKSIYEINDTNYIKWLLENFKDMNKGDKILINQFYKYGYIPYNPMFWKHTKSANKNKTN